MADEEVTNDAGDSLKTCHHKRGQCSAKVTRIATKLALMNTKCPDQWHAYELKDHEDVILQQRKERERIQEDILESFTLTEKEKEDDETASDKFDDAASSRLWEIARMRKVNQAHREFRNLLDDVRMLALEESSKHTSHQVDKCEERFAVLRLSDGLEVDDGGALKTLNQSVKTELYALSRTAAREREDRAAAETPADRRPTDDEGTDRRRSDYRSTSRLPRIQIPTFKGDCMEWPSFWDIFNRSVCENKELAEDEKVSYLKQAIQDPNYPQAVDTSSATPGRFNTYVKQLKARYDRKRKRHSKFTTDFFHCPPCTSVSGPELHKLHARLSGSIRNLRYTGQFTAGQLATAHAETLLPAELSKEWHLKESDPQVVPNIDSLLDFIEIHANLPCNQPDPAARPRNDRRPAQERGKHEDRPKKQAYATNTGRPCTLCKEAAHPLYFCEQFKTMTVAERTDLVKQKRLCFNCLSHGHNTRECVSSYKCKTCSKPHHTMLHREYRQREDREEETRTSAAASIVNRRVHLPGIFIPTLLLMAQSQDKKEVQVRAMLDNGSTISLIKASVVKQLGLKTHRQTITIVGARGAALGTARGLVRFVLKSRQVPGVQIDMTAYVVDTVAANLPETKATNSWTFLKAVTLGDPGFNVPSGIDLLLGNDILDDIIRAGTIRGAEEYPRATNTLFGWVVEGRMAERELPAENKEEATAFCASISKLSIAEATLAAHQEANSLLKQFWEVEEIPSDAPVWTPEEAEAMEHFTRTHRITQEGRFQVTLPRKATAGHLGSSRGRALKRFELNEASLIRRGKWEKFQEVVNEYLTLDHAEAVPACELHLPPQDSYYMPMHAVLKATSTTTKLRVVFDASATTTSGLSFNETLLTGPTIQKTLTDILIRFRTHRVAVSADISKMYRAIELTPPDRNFHRFLWRRTLADPVTDHRMKRVTFGVTASPFVATRVLQEVAARAMKDAPDAADSIQNCFYVDDYLTGAKTYEEASTLCKQVMQLLDVHGLTLRKWRSSSAGFLGSIPPELLETSEEATQYGPEDYQKTLGIHWDSCSDYFYVSTSQFNLPATLTKRLLSSDIHRTFDVLGWLTPVTLTMKVLLQTLWELKIGWDEVIPSATQQEWTDWRSQLPELAALPIPRYYYRKESIPCSIQLHGFADASMKAYAAVIYLRAEYHGQTPTVTLVTSKTRVAPLKPLTVPKLELCAAHLLAKLMKIVMDTLNVSISDVTCWTDSTIVLNWLDGSARRYRTYVANRIVNTLELIPGERWKHVPTTTNPADCASRGIMPTELINHPLWWTGPDWLQTDPISFPPQPSNKVELLERKIVAQIRVQEPPWLVARWSTFTRLRRVAAWIIRFTQQSRPSARRPGSKTLSVQELEESDRVLLQASQERSFGHGTGKGERSMELRALHPFRDSKGLIRVGGRLANAGLSHSQQHPVIIHSKDPLSKLMILQCHKDTGHAGPNLVLTKLSSQYHMVRAMRQIKTICSSCVTCRKIRAKPAEQLMGQLPAHRVKPGKVFEIVGIDYAGPILIKYAHVRKPTMVKAYICVFICMATRAIHLEAVTDSTTEAFIACLERFIARRGRPNTIYSDNGSNFVGAARQLEAVLLPTPTSKEAVANHCTNLNIIWKFSPERAPHFGGMWEAGVKSMKHHLRRIMGDTKLTYEELATVLAKIEAMLNGRPLSRLHAHNEEGIEVLTPGHFIIGRPLEALPDRNPQPTTSLTRRWNLCQELTRHFWSRWSQEYVTQLQRRDKWMDVKPNFKENDIVLMKEDGLVKPDWPLARVVKTFPGKDGLVRVVLLKAKNSTFKRPVAKLAMILPSMDASQDAEKGSTLLRGGMTESEKQPTQDVTRQEGTPQEGLPT